MKHMWSLGPLREFCGLLSCSWAMSSYCCGLTHLSHELQQMFTYVPLYCVTQQFYNSAWIHQPPGSCLQYFIAFCRMHAHILKNTQWESTVLRKGWTTIYIAAVNCIWTVKTREEPIYYEKHITCEEVRD